MFDFSFESRLFGQGVYSLEQIAVITTDNAYTTRLPGYKSRAVIGESVFRLSNTDLHQLGQSTLSVWHHLDVLSTYNTKQPLHYSCVRN